MEQTFIDPMETTVVAEDCELLNEFAQAGSSSAFEAVMQRHAGWVFAVALRQLRDVQLAEDATQTVFLLLARKAKSLGKQGRISGWLFETIQNTVRNIQRARRRRVRHERRAARERSPVAHAAEFEELLGRVDAAVESLDEENRTAVVLRFHRGLDYEQVAASLGTTEAAARKRVGRAIVRLRRMLGARIDESMLAGLTAWGLHAMPAGMAGGAAGGLGNAGAVSKGAILMGAAKTKLVAGGVIAAILLGGSIVTVIVTARIYMRGKQPAGAPVVIPQHVDSFAQYYGVPAGAGVVLVDPAAVPVDVRLSLYRQRNPAQAARMPQGPTSMIVRWTGDLPPSGNFAFGNPSVLPKLVEKLLDVYPGEIVGDQSLLNVNGDFAYTDQASTDQYLLAIEKIVQKADGGSIHLSIQNIERAAVVFRGNWKFEQVAVPDVPMANGAVVIYTWLPFVGRSSGSGTMRQLAGDIELRLANEEGKPVVFEADGTPHQIQWITNREDRDDSRLMLDHIAQQTGLKWSEEKRKLRCLVIERK